MPIFSVIELILSVQAVKKTKEAAYYHYFVISVLAKCYLIMFQERKRCEYVQNKTL